MRNGIWVRTLNVPNLNYERRERLVHNSAKVVPLQVFGKFSVFPPYTAVEKRNFPPCFWDFMETELYDDFLERCVCPF